MPEKEKVKRYRFEIGHGYKVVDPEGPWVRHEEYEKLEKLLQYIVLAVCDPVEAAKGNMPTQEEAVISIIDKNIALTSENERLRKQLDELALVYKLPEAR